MCYGGVTAPIAVSFVNSAVVEYLYWFLMPWVHEVCWWGHSKIHKNDTSKALQCTRHVVLLGYATIKLAKLKIVNDIVTRITGKWGKLWRILSDAFKCTEARLSYVCNNISTPLAPLLCIKLRRDLRSDFQHQWLYSALDFASSIKIDKDTKATKKQTKTKRPELHHAQQIVSARLAPGAEIVMVVTCTFFRFVSFREPHRYSNLLRTQESPSIVNLIGPDTSHVIRGNLFRTSTFIESLKETNKIETKQ